LKDFEFYGHPKSDDSILNEILSDCLIYITGEGAVNYLPKRYEENWAMYEFFKRVVMIVRKKINDKMERLK